MAQPTTTRLGLALGTRPAGTKQTPALTGTIKIMCLGDSITVGFTGLSDSYYSYRQYLAEMLTASGVAFTAVGVVTSTAPAWTKHRASVGSTINDANTSYFADGPPPAEFVSADPDLFVIYYGYNDINTGSTGAATLTRWTTLMEKIRNFTNGRGVSPRVVVSYLAKGATATDTQIANFNSGLAAAVATQVGLGQKVTLVDPRPWLDGINGAQPHRLDNLHPVGNGYRLMADCFFPGVLNAIGLDAEWGRPTS